MKLSEFQMPSGQMVSLDKDDASFEEMLALIKAIYEGGMDNYDTRSVLRFLRVPLPRPEDTEATYAAYLWAERASFIGPASGPILTPAGLRSLAIAINWAGLKKFKWNELRGTHYHDFFNIISASFFRVVGTTTSSTGPVLASVSASSAPGSSVNDGIKATDFQMPSGQVVPLDKDDPTFEDRQALIKAIHEIGFDNYDIRSVLRFLGVPLPRPEDTEATYAVYLWEERTSFVGGRRSPNTFNSFVCAQGLKSLATSICKSERGNFFEKPKRKCYPDIFSIFSAALFCDGKSNDQDAASASASVSEDKDLVEDLDLDLDLDLDVDVDLDLDLDVDIESPLVSISPSDSPSAQANTTRKRDFSAFASDSGSASATATAASAIPVSASLSRSPSAPSTVEVVKLTEFPLPSGQMVSLDKDEPTFDERVALTLAIQDGRMDNYDTRSVLRFLGVPLPRPEDAEATYAAYLWAERASFIGPASGPLLNPSGLKSLASSINWVGLVKRGYKFKWNELRGTHYHDFFNVISAYLFRDEKSEGPPEREMLSEWSKSDDEDAAAATEEDEASQETVRAVCKTKRLSLFWTQNLCAVIN